MNVRSINAILDDELAVLKKNGVSIDRQIELAIAIQMQESYEKRTLMLSNAFVVSPYNDYPSALEKIAMELESFRSMVGDFVGNYHDDILF